jgi:hypothetical protein
MKTVREQGHRTEIRACSDFGEHGDQRYYDDYYGTTFSGLWDILTECVIVTPWFDGLRAQLLILSSLVLGGGSFSAYPFFIL